MPHAAVRPHGALPFFEFMLYGAKSFAGPTSAGDVAWVGRGRRCALVEAAAGRRLAISEARDVPEAVTRAGLPDPVSPMHLTAAAITLGPGR